MALKDIFTMIKADRYTADGCEEIKKAQEAIAEDAGAPDGTMSHRKDGDYIKQGGKWIPAPAAKTGAKKPSDKQKLAKGIVSAMEERKANPPAKSEGVKNKAELAKQIVSAMEKKNGESKPAGTSWKDAKYSLVNKAGVPLDITTVTFSMTPAWARSHGFSPDDVNGHEAQRKTASQIIRNQDWSNPEEAVKKINEMDFGYNNWKVTEKQADKVKIESRDRLGNVHELTIKRPEATPPASTESKPEEAPKFKSRNTIMLEKKGFKEVEKGGAYPKLHRFEYKSKSGKTYNVYRDIGSDGFFYHVQTPGGFTKKMSDVGEIKKYLDSDGGNWGHAPGPRGLVSRPYTEKDLVKSNNDAAPRQLTGDCKVRVRKSK